MTSFNRSLVFDYYGIQDLRIASEGRARAIRQGKADGDAEYIADNLATPLLAIEKNLVREIKRQVVGVDIYDQWLKHVKGIGPIFSGNLIGYIGDPARFQYPASLWAYAGLAVKDGVAVRLQKGQKASYCVPLKSTCFLISDAFIKNKNRGSVYGELYDKMREYYDKKYPEPIATDKKYKDGKPVMKYSPKHKHMMAGRYAVKRFLCDMLTVWKDIRGIENTKPWIIEHGGHKDFEGPLVPLGLRGNTKM